MDTSIWLDLFENRNEPNLPKGDYAKLLLKNIITNKSIIIYSTVVIFELKSNGYTYEDIKLLFEPIRKILYYADAREFMGRARDIGIKRNIPKGDVAHALIARHCKAVMVTRDGDYYKLGDIIKPQKPENLI